MGRKVTRVPVAVAAAAVLGTLAMTGASASGAAADAPPGPAARAAAAAPGTQLWVQRYGNGSADDHYPVLVAVSPGGGRVFVTGSSRRTTGGARYLDYATVAYNAATGRRLWVARYNGPSNHREIARAIAVSPSGGTVFVTGQSFGSGRDHFATVAYDAATGKQLWVQRYSPAGTSSAASAVAVSPGGGRVFVTGPSVGQDATVGATVAYRADTGRRLWARHYGEGVASAVAVSPGGGTVFVTGVSTRTATDLGQYGTVAYRAATGKQVWAKRDGDGVAYSVAVSPGGGTVFVTGGAFNGDYATVAYRASTGAQLWASRYHGPADLEDKATALVVSPTGGTVFVTGATSLGTGGSDYATVAYNAATGAQLWVARYNGPANGNDYAKAIAISRTGRTVFVTGESEGTAHATKYATVAYNATTGAQLWLRRYDHGSASSIAASPRGSQVFVTGLIHQDTAGEPLNDYGTIAYRG